MTLLTEQDLELSSSPSDTCPSESSASPQPATGDVSCSSEPPPSIAPLEAREKRRRSRVTPEQLLHLEQYFATDRSPTGARRKEIGDLLGMHERQTQIWFQNRRAKAKLHDGKIKLSSVTKLHFAVQPPELCAGFDHDLQSLVHEDESIIIIPCTELSVGTWKRIGITKYDLVAYICEAKKCITWFIHSAGHSFKMELPFNTIVDTSFTNVAPGMGVAILRLIQPPLFYLEHIAATDPNGTPIRLWQQCVDWTEGMQASKVMYHELTGSVVQLAPILQYLKFNELGDRMSSYMPSQPTILPSSGRLSTATMLSHDQSSGPLYVYPGSRSPSHESLSLIPCDSFDSQSRNPSGVFEHASFCSLDYSASSVTGGPSSAGYPSSSTLPALSAKQSRYSITAHMHCWTSSVSLC
ncbi:hypothetical protein B0H21DRAFT_697043 [Amylocystis lapponica]|nr:hypothetical protein B0H21DRAFT_697043 [Amylocystis lapponica]